MKQISGLSNRDLKETIKLGLLNFDCLVSTEKPAMKRRLLNLEVEAERRGIVQGSKALELRRIIDGLVDVDGKGTF